MTTSLNHTFHSLTELYQAYMGFLQFGGLFVPGEESRPLGQQVTLCFTLPGEQVSCRVTGPVVWINTEADGRHPKGVGIAFPESFDGERRRIEQLLADRLGSARLTWTL